MHTYCKCGETGRNIHYCTLNASAFEDGQIVQVCLLQKMNGSRFFFTLPEPHFAGFGKIFDASQIRDRGSGRTPDGAAKLCNSFLPGQPFVVAVHGHGQSSLLHQPRLAFHCQYMHSKMASAVNWRLSPITDVIRNGNVTRCVKDGRIAAYWKDPLKFA